MNRLQLGRILHSCLIVVIGLCQYTAAADKPIATIAVVSNPYITTKLADQILDERGTPRGFLAQTGPDSMRKTVALLNQLKPDAVVILGSQTWSGTEEDFAAAGEFVRAIEAPTFMTPGHFDRPNGSLEQYLRHFSQHDASRTLKNINGVHLVFADDLHRAPDTATALIEQQLSRTGETKAIILLGGKAGNEFSRSRLTTTHAAFWSLIETHKIALRIEPTRYNHQVGFERSLPIWTVGSTAWSARGAVSVVRVFSDSIEIAEVTDPTQPVFSLRVPNPVTAARLPEVADDPYGCPTYSADLAAKPEFTFALVSDPQFDRVKNRATLISRATAAIDELNRLKPAMVYIAGDLVNNNLPEEWDLFNQTFARLIPPWYAAPGNHDVLFNYDFVEASHSSAPEKYPDYDAIVKRAVDAVAKQENLTGPTALFQKFTGNPPQQTIEYGECAFICVSFLTQRAEPKQLAFLRQQLARTQQKQHVFVVAHYPALPFFGNNIQPTLGGNEVLALLAEHRVTGFLFGHRHRNGFRFYERTAHVLTDNMGTIHLLHVFSDRVVIGRKRVGAPLYERMTIYSPRK
jgi:3',5'-cyclic AMP phosphodiesterase CpdA